MIDEFANSAEVIAAAQQVPSQEWPNWVRYGNDVEHGKRTCNERQQLPHRILGLLEQLHQPEAVARLQELTGITELIADPYMHGAGLHVMASGAWLQTHADYELHPHMVGMERRLSLILCLSSAPFGELLLCDGMGEPKQALRPKMNRALIFENGPASFHGVRKVYGDNDRVTLAAYYLAPARATAVRRRAMFLPNRDGGQCPREVR